jgi:hypothetical protein
VIGESHVPCTIGCISISSNLYPPSLHNTCSCYYLYSQIDADKDSVFWLANLHPSWKKIGCISIPSKSVQVSCMVYTIKKLEFKKLGCKTFFSNLHNRSKWVMGFTSKLQGRQILTCCTFVQLNLTFISYSFWNIRRKVLKFYKFDEKRAITPRWVFRLKILELLPFFHQIFKILIYFVSRLVFFANTPDKHDISVYNYTLYKNAGFWLVNSLITPNSI